MFSPILLSLLGEESSEKGLCSPWKGRNLFLCRTNLMRFPSSLLTHVYQVLVVTCQYLALIPIDLQAYVFPVYQPSSPRPYPLAQEERSILFNHSAFCISGPF